ncbi:hypothetical protein [Nocardioides sp.]|uniref:hypothetical protein n=1 Tax=Nocardioides sp. TaxID=35761 RepID=UPI003783555E
MDIRALRTSVLIGVAALVTTLATAGTSTAAAGPLQDREREGRSAATFKTSLAPLARVSDTNGARGSAQIGGRLVFAATTTRAGLEPWVTDGTQAGTRMVADLVPGGSGSDPRGFVAYRGRFYFLAGVASGGYGLWTTDGTRAGTQIVFDELIGAANLVRAGSRLFFVGATTSHGAELWTSDGTGAGTREVTDLWAGAGNGVTAALHPARNTVVFAGWVSDHVRKPWVSDGTAAGTERLDTYPGEVDLHVGDLDVWGDRLVVAAGDDRSGRELWGGGIVAGSVDGVKDIRDGADASDPNDFTHLRDRWVFTAATPEQGRELFVTDGTSGGTGVLRDIVLGEVGSFATEFLPGARRVFFRAARADGQYDLWSTAGTTATTRMVRLPAGIEEGYPLGRLGARVVLKGVTPSGAPRVMTAVDDESSRLEVVKNGAVDLPPDATVDWLGWLGNTGLVGIYRGNSEATIARWTIVPSRTTVPRLRVCPAAQRWRVPVTVRAPGGVPNGGVVTVELDGRPVGRASLRGGNATVRMSLKVKPGRYRVRARWSGSIQAAGSASAAGIVRFVRGKGGGCS